MSTSYVSFLCSLVTNFSTIEQFASFSRLLPQLRSDYTIMGLGKCTAPLPAATVTSETSVATAAATTATAPTHTEAFFLVLDWPSAAALRAAAGLPPAAFHITLGFSVTDLHGPGIDKGPKSLIMHAQLPKSLV